MYFYLGFWPAQVAPTCNFPPSILETCTNFESFYYNIHTGRRLTWHANLGTADIKCQFNRRHEINVTTYQMCILLLFNSKNEISVRDIADITKIHLPDLKRHLLSLCVPTFRILNKSSKSKDIEDGDVVGFIYFVIQM